MVKSGRFFCVFFSLLLILSFAAGLLLSCSPAKRPAPRTGPGTLPVPPSPVQVIPSNPSTRPPESSAVPGENRFARRIAREAERVAGVERAESIVFGNTAIVGIYLGHTGNTDILSRVEARIRNRFRDEGIYYVFLTADPAMVQEIHDISNNLEQGRPVTNYTARINDLMEALRPEQPAVP